MSTTTTPNTNTAPPSGAPREAHQRSIFSKPSEGDQTLYGHPMGVEQMAQCFGEPIHTYTRAQAIEDGILVDITETAKEAGFSCPVAITAVAWGDCVAWADVDSKRQAHQDEAGRLWDVVWMASRAARRGGMETLFQLYRVPRGGRGVRPRLATLKMLAGPGDNGELVITILMQGED